MTDYRDDIYSLYATHHVGQRLAPAEAGARVAGFLRRRYRRWLPADPQAAILDLGCGNGSVLYWLQQEGYTRLAGVDTSPEQVELARQVCPAVEKADARAFLAAHPEQYDAILALDFLEHFRREEALPLLRGVHQALRPGGRVILQTINADSPLHAHILYGDPTHQTAYTARSLETLVRVAGFERVEFRPLGPVPHGPVSAVRWLLWQLIALGLRAYHLIEMGTADRAIFTQCFAACAWK